MMNLVVMLANIYEKGMNGSRKDKTQFSKPPEGWYAAEKYDGYRALFYYDEEENPIFISRSGKQFNAPEIFLEAMPPAKLLKGRILDGELWAGRENFDAMGTVRRKDPNPEDWLIIQYVSYDITNIEKPFCKRLEDLKEIVRITRERWTLKKKHMPYPFHNMNCPLSFAPQMIVKNHKQLDDYYKMIIDGGGEGVMLKHPTCKYENGRSANLLKMKPTFDHEAIIIGYKSGNGKYSGILGGFECSPLINHGSYSSVDESESHKFTLSGMDDEIRNNYKETHPIGTIITYECSGFTNRGVPRFGRYVRIRDDITIKKHIIEGNKKILRIIEIFEKLETNYKNNKDHFRARSYSKVIPGIKKLISDEFLTEDNFDKISGLGVGLREKIRLIIETSTCPEYDKLLKNKDKIEIRDKFLKIHGVGPECAKKLTEAGFHSIEQLRSEEKISDYLNEVQMKGLFYYEDVLKRIPYKEIVKHEKYLNKILKKIDPSAELTIAGSYRRKKDTSGDIDILLKASEQSIYDKLIDSLIKKGYIQETLSRGPKKFMGMSNIDTKEFKKINRRIDIMYTTPQEYPFAVLYFTGSKDFNVTMRNWFLEKGLTLNEYGIQYTDKRKKMKYNFITEKDIFDHFNYEYVNPDLR